MNLKAQTLLDAITSHPTGGGIVEIGCVRADHEIASDGYSTVYLARAAQQAGRRFDTVDIDPDAVALASRLTDGTGARVHHDDGERYLRDRGGLIGVLYLDGALDAGQAVAQYRAARLARRALVVIDDAQPELGLDAGKATGLLAVLEADGFEVTVVATEPGYRMAIAKR